MPNKKQTPKEPKGETLWAIIRIGARASWITTYTLAYARRDSIRLYLDMWLPEQREKIRRSRNKDWYSSKVLVTPIPAPTKRKGKK